MKSLEDLMKIRDAAKNNMAMRSDDKQKYRVVVGPVLNTLVEEVANQDLPATVLQTGCIGMCTLEPIVEVFDRDDNKTTYVLVDAKKAKEIAVRHLKNDEIIDEYTVGHYKK